MTQTSFRRISDQVLVRGLLFLAAVLLVVAQFLPYTDDDDPLWQGWLETFRLLLDDPSLMVEQPVDVAIFFSIITFGVFVLVLPFIAGFLARAKPLLWALRLLAVCVFVSLWFSGEIFDFDLRGDDGPFLLVMGLALACVVGGYFRLAPMILWGLRFATLGVYAAFQLGGTLYGEFSIMEVAWICVSVIACWIAKSLEPGNVRLWLVRAAAATVIGFIAMENLGAFGNWAGFSLAAYVSALVALGLLLLGPSKQPVVEAEGESVKRDEPVSAVLEENAVEPFAIQPAGQRKASLGGVMLLLAAALLVAAQFLPTDGDTVEPFFKSWKDYWPDVDHIRTCASRNTHIQNLLTQIGFLMYWLLVLAMPWMVGWLRRMAPLLWSMRLLSLGMAGYLGWKGMSRGEAGLVVILICAAIGVMMWVAVKIWKPSKGTLWVLGVIGFVQIAGIFVMNPPQGEWFTTSAMLMVVAVSEAAGLFLTQRVKQGVSSQQNAAGAIATT